MRANKYDDPSFKPVSNVCVDLHDNFLDAYELCDADQQKLPLVAPDKVKDKLAGARHNVSYFFSLYYSDSDACLRGDIGAY